MRILAVSDLECPAYWDYYEPGRLKDFDLILSCGDLKADYLSFLVTMARCPVLYVPGNHDISYDLYPPEGCDDIDGHFVVYNGLRILGLGGCKRYHPGIHQYDERQMAWRIWKLKHVIRKAGGVDIIVTHAPPQGLGDGKDPAHQGFQCFRALIDEFRPKYLVHGHVHLNYSNRSQRVLEYRGTRILNAYERFAFTLPDMPADTKDKGQVIYKTKQKLPDYF